MTKKDYVLIAQILKDTKADAAIVRKFALELALRNPAFDRARFISACGVNAA